MTEVKPTVLIHLISEVFYKKYNNVITAFMRWDIQFYFKQRMISTKGNMS